MTLTRANEGINKHGFAMEFPMSQLLAMKNIVINVKPIKTKEKWFCARVAARKTRILLTHQRNHKRPEKVLKMVLVHKKWFSGLLGTQTTFSHDKTLKVRFVNISAFTLILWLEGFVTCTRRLVFFCAFLVCKGLFYEIKIDFICFLSYFSLNFLFIFADVVTVICPVRLNATLFFIFV